MKNHPDQIPAAPIRRALETWVRRQGVDRSVAEGYAANLIASGSTAEDTMDVENARRRIYDLLHSQKTIGFDFADRILCRLGMQNLWSDDPELRAIYQEIDLTWLDYAKPTCPEVDQRNRRKVRALYDRSPTLSAVGTDLDLPLPLVRRLLAEAA